MQPISREAAKVGNKKIVRVDEIDIAKGLGILLVIVGHLLPEDSWMRQIIYSFHMPLFMFISGGLFYYTKIRKGKKYQG